MFVNGKDLEKLAQQNTDWAKTGFSSSTKPVVAEKAEKVVPKTIVDDVVESETGLTKKEINILRSALYRINSITFSSCKCKGCEPAKEENQKLFHDLDRLIKRHEKSLERKVK